MTNEKFTRLVSCWLDGSLTEIESAELQAELERSASRRDDFVDLCEMDADLRLISDSVLEPHTNRNKGDRPLLLECGPTGTRIKKA